MVYRSRLRRIGASVYLDAAPRSRVLSAARPQPLPRDRASRQQDEPLPWIARPHEVRLSPAFRCTREAPDHRLGTAATGERRGPGAGQRRLQPEQAQGPAGPQNIEARAGGRAAGLDAPGRVLRSQGDLACRDGRVPFADTALSVQRIRYPPLLRHHKTSRAPYRAISPGQAALTLTALSWRSGSV